MTALIVGLVALALGATIQRLMLRHHGQSLKAKEQAFRFHAIRDELQLLAIQQIIDPKSEIYAFLIGTANFAIRNAGVMGLRDVLAVARRVKQEAPAWLADGLASQPVEVQKITAETFDALTHMLIANDPLVRAGLWCAQATARGWFFLRRPLRACMRAMDALARLVAPSHAEAVTYARDYSRMARLPVAA